MIINGPPASGKSTVALLVARELALPLVAKDTIKEALMECLPVPDVDASRQLGQAAVRTMLAVARASPHGAVLDSNFHRSALGELLALPGPVIELFCCCDRAVAASRYRVRAGTRHVGHFDRTRTPDELWNDEVSHPLAGGWPVLEIDTNVTVDLPAIAAWLRRLMRSDESRQTA